MERQNRFAMAIAIAPLSVPIIFLVIALSNSMSFDEFIGPWSLLVFSIIAGASYMGTLLIGLPIALILRRFGYLTLWALAISGALGGTIVGYVIHLGFNNHDLPNQPPHSEIGTAIYFSLFGVVVAIVFGLIAIVRYR